MADVTISDLSPLTPSTGLVLPVSNGSTTGSVTLSQVCGVMTSAQITSALGYTPYNSTNPAGYISSIPAGGVVQVKQIFYNDIFTTTSNSYVTIPGFSVSITPKSTINSILVRLSLTGGIWGHFGAVRVYRNETPIGLPLSRNGVPDINRCWFNMYDDSDTNDAKTQSMEYLDSPNTSSQITYTPRIACSQNGGTFVINDMTSQARNQTYSGNFVSSLTLMEIAG